MAGRFPSLLRQDRRGAAATLLALSLTTLTGAAAVSVDLGSAYLARRQLQGIADAAVLAAAAGDVAGTGMASAQSVIDQSGVADISIDALTPGIYTRNAAIAPAARFTPAATNSTAARLTLEREVPLFFGKMILGRPTMTVSASATAARTDMAAFSIGTRLAALSGGLANDLLSSLAGTSLNLSVLDTQGLVSADMDLLHVADALRVRLNRPDASYAELFGEQIPVQDVVRAMGDVVSSVAARDALAKVAAHLGSDTVRLDDMIDLGPLGSGSSAGDGSAIKVDAFSLLRATLQLARGNATETSLNLAVPGLAAVKLIIASGSGTARSPWMTVTDSRDVIIRTGRLRLYLEVKVASVLAGIATIRVPLYVELAEAQARLSDIACGGSLSDGVTLAVTPSIGSAAIGDIDVGQIRNFSAPMPVRTATLVDILGIRIKAGSSLALGGVQPKSVHFTTSDIANHVTRTVQTDDAVAGLAASLASNVHVSVTTLGITVSAGPVVSAVGSQLGVLAPTLDGLINQVTGLLGVRLGMADVRVDRMRCGVPLLVA